MILGMYVTLMPVIFAGAANMIFTRTDFYKKHCKPIDGGKFFSDGKRIFGDNKTWAGFFGMIFFGAFFQMLWGYVCSASESMESINELYVYYPNRTAYNLTSGALFGLSYVLFELPNSFIKRRIGITPGKTAKGAVGLAFFIIDQIDSLIGVVLVLSLLSKISFAKYCLYILLGALTHIAVNLVLYALKIRKNF